MQQTNESKPNHEAQPLIYASINKVMKGMGAIGKNKKNATQGFMYRGVDDVMNALQPEMVKHGIFVVPHVLEHMREERKTAKGGLLIYTICKVRYIFYALDGSYVEAVVYGEGMDSGDKSTNKALSVAYKYACFQAFSIPTEELHDPDAESPVPAPKTTPQKTASKKAPAKTAPAQKLTATQLRDITQEISRTGVPLKRILDTYKVNQLSELSSQQFDSCMKKLKVTPDKAPTEEKQNE